MNVVKFKEGSKPSIQKLDGKYAYLVAGRYAFPFEDINDAIYLSIERMFVNNYQELLRNVKQHNDQLIHDPYFWNVDIPQNTFFDIYKENTNYIDVINNIAMLDEVAMSTANSTRRWRELNTLAYGGTLTMEQLRRFRTMVAEELLKIPSLLEEYFGKDTPRLERVLSMLNYYKNEMSDQVVETLTLIENNGHKNAISISSGCGCSSNSNTALVQTTQTTCVEEYRVAIYNIMVETFADVKFWKAVSDNANNILQNNLVYNIREYVLEILRRNLLLAPSVPDWYSYCMCGDGMSGEQERLRYILQRLADACKMIYEGKEKENGNFVAQAFYDWARASYQTMRW